MRSLGFLLNPWGLLLQGLAILHFIRRRPDFYWLWIIIFLGPLGALVYIAIEVVPDVGLLRQSFGVFPRRKRMTSNVAFGPFIVKYVSFPSAIQS